MCLIASSATVSKKCKYKIMQRQPPAAAERQELANAKLLVEGLDYVCNNYIIHD
jgi:hypothetical protein